MNEPAESSTEIEAELADAFDAGANRYAELILDPDHEVWLDPSRRRALGEYSLGEGVLADAAGLLAEQSLQRVGSELEDFVNSLHGRARGDAHAQTLMMALLLVGRRVADAAQLKDGETVFGDQLRGLEQLVIEPDVGIGDFQADFFLTYAQLGPNPAARDDPTQPSGMTVTRRLALVRELTHRGAYRDNIIRRQALAGALDITAVSYDDADIVRDPFALASRVVRELAQSISDELYG
jgi:hypothetical protein